LPRKSSKAQPQLIFICGVSGAGKSTVAKALADQLNAVFVEGDTLHSAESVAKMSQGIPLQEHDRAPWLARLTLTATQKVAHGYTTVVCFSGLKVAHREKLMAVHDDVKLVMLAPSEQELKQRLMNRQEHFFDGDLLSSQLAALEMPTATSNTLVLDDDTTNDLARTLELITNFVNADN